MNETERGRINGIGRDVSDYCLVLLNLLLDKYEAGRAFKTGDGRRPRLVPARSQLGVEYYDEMDHHKRELIHQAVDVLVQKGVIEAIWPRFKQGLELSAICLNLDKLQLAYELSGRVPKSSKIDVIRKTLAPLAHHPWEWVREYRRKTDELLALKRTAGIDLDDSEGYSLLTASLRALAELDESQPKRVFSQSIFGDSKLFEESVERRLISLLKRYGPYEYETDEEYLDSVGLYSNPRTVLFAGPLVLGFKGPVLSFADIPGEIGLSETAIKNAEIIGGEFSHILTVENLTAFYQAVRSKTRKNGLIIYTGGFPHRGIQRLLVRLKESMSAHSGAVRPVYHWGDLDYGGIRIFMYLQRTFFPGLQPYLMDTDTYRRYKDHGTSFGSNYAQKLKRLLGDREYTQWHQIITEILNEGKVLEQEAVGYKALE